MSASLFASIAFAVAAAVDEPADSGTTAAIAGIPSVPGVAGAVAVAVAAPAVANEIDAAAAESFAAVAVEAFAAVAVEAVADEAVADESVVAEVEVSGAAPGVEVVATLDAVVVLVAAVPSQTGHVAAAVGRTVAADIVARWAGLDQVRDFELLSPSPGSE